MTTHLKQEYTVPASGPVAPGPVVTRIVSEEVVPMTVELSQRGCEVTRRLIGVPVDEVPPIRHEGDRMIVPVVEERLVKQLFLTEEIMITPRQSTEVRQSDVSLRRQTIEVEGEPDSAPQE